MYRLAAAFSLALLALSVPPVTFAVVIYQDKTAEAGLDVTYVPDCSLGSGPGAAFGDWDNDGDLDLYVGRDSQGDLLFRNNGNGRFSEVSSTYISAPNAGMTHGVAWGDVDRDGDLDLYVANENIQNVFYKNLLAETGTPTLMVASGEFGLVESQVRNSKGVSFVDINLDGRLDIYVANYEQDPNYIYVQRSNGTFIENGAALGVDDEGFGFTSIFTDYDRDGDPDLYVVNDFSQFFDTNKLYKNMKKETGVASFVDVTALAGDLANDKGMGMGAAAGDYNGDGLIDLYVTNLGINTLYRNNGDGTFDDVTRQVGVEGELETVSWGTAFIDFDNDRDFDLFCVNGFIYDKAEGFPPQADQFFRCNTNHTYDDYTFGSNFGDDLNARAAVCADYDKDGDVDIFVTTSARLPSPGSTRPLFFKNNGGSVFPWLGIRLYGVASNPHGIGARVTVTAGGVDMVQEVYGGSSYLTQNSTWLLFGLKDASTADQVKVEWPSGTVDVISDVAARQYVSIVEGVGPVAVTLQSCRVRYERGGVSIDWDVHSDGDLTGFSVDRRSRETMPFANLAGPYQLPAATAGPLHFRDETVRVGSTYEYRLRAHYASGGETDLVHRTIVIPAVATSLAQNVPNPFNPSTQIEFNLSDPGNVQLDVFDGAGRRVRTLVSEFREAGGHTVAWDGRDGLGRIAAAGIYFYRLCVEKTSVTRKMVLLK